MIKQIDRLLDKYSVAEIINCATEQAQRRHDIETYDQMNAQQREEHWVHYVEDILGLTIDTGRSQGRQQDIQCLFVKEFKDLQKQGLVCTNPYFMFWRESTSHKSGGHIEFGHWHMEKKWYKEFPGTEYFQGKLEQERMMNRYYLEYRNIVTDILKS